MVAFTCEHSPRLICDACDGMTEIRRHHENGKLHRHEDGTTHRHGAPYGGSGNGDVAEWLDDGPETPWKPDLTPREE